MDRRRDATRHARPLRRLLRLQHARNAVRHICAISVSFFFNELFIFHMYQLLIYSFFKDFMLLLAYYCSTFFPLCYLSREGVGSYDDAMREGVHLSEASLQIACFAFDPRSIHTTLSHSPPGCYPMRRFTEGRGFHSVGEQWSDGMLMHSALQIGANDRISRSSLHFRPTIITGSGAQP